MTEIAHRKYWKSLEERDLAPWSRPPCRAAIALVLAALLPLACTRAVRGEEPSATPAPAYDIDEHLDLLFRRVAGEQLRMNLFVPKTEGDRVFPGVIWVHGGGWALGTHRDLSDRARATAREGFVSASIDYRLLPKHWFADTIDDVRYSVRWLRAHAGKHRLDPDRIGAVGDSAGGHLVSLLGTADPPKPRPGDYASVSSRVQCVAALYGVHDFTDGEFEAYVVHRMPGPLKTNRDAYVVMSPIHHVSKDDPPFLLAHGTKDKTVSISQSRRMHAALRAAGVDSELLEVAGGDHGFNLGPAMSISRDEVYRRVHAFLRAKLGQPAQTPRAPAPEPPRPAGGAEEEF
ncbi:MAG: alpha/beta hydrolase [Planctomycetes bacterium]|nr:alpha/beta hydrolase [Planctomycetota bacterium]